MDWRQRAREALETAEAARASGNEGMARVCARRAGGWAADANLKQGGADIGTPSLLEPMRQLQDQGGTSLRAKEILGHLLTVKKKDSLESDSYFPLDVDLVAEARELIGLLFAEG
ncbi:MAG: hypothetical protein WD751_00695 [Anaerolineales bacterium]